jgi:uncharacterized protein
MAEPHFVSVDDYVAAQDEPHRVTLENMLRAITAEFPDLELTLAWNVPHFKRGKHYIAGISCLKDNLAFSPWSAAVMKEHRQAFSGLESTKNLIRIPLGWQVDGVLLRTLMQARLDELDA